ncbi:unnamed protein product [Chironomus riparius]|uniref:CLIP domain-containing serine protease n=1 Tax=Chironomus riparius TaxID=315576 RepID=A0A9N9WPP1_9DIPT|nr:unnamed protein product [Chironomus riparius]
MFCDTNLIILVLIFINIFTLSESFIYAYDDEDLIEGEKCLTKNNEPGQCIEFLKCNFANKLYRAKRSSEITVCSLVGRIPFVCCPTYPKISNFSKPIKKSSFKFQKALCKNTKPIDRIENHVINGDKAKVAEFPFQVALGYGWRRSKKLEFNCGGSLIADDIVLTAAHCVNKKGAQPFMVRMGRTCLNLDDKHDRSTVQDIEIEKIRIHPKYSSKSKQNDIAIIKLVKPFIPSESIATICLSTSDADAPEDFTITGFGLTSIDFNERSDWLLRGTLSEYPFEKCKRKFENKGVRIADSQFCGFSDNGVDTCQGDSGGPVFYERKSEFYLHGITSYGFGCGSSYYPAVYTKVNSFLNWIEVEMTALE